MLISILISNYNKNKYLQKCIESCLNQSYSNIEIFFGDNESTDDSLSTAKKYGIRAKKYGIRAKNNGTRVKIERIRKRNDDLKTNFDENY